jgi:hypothetical protein
MWHVSLRLKAFCPLAAEPSSSAEPLLSAEPSVIMYFEEQVIAMILSART